MTNNFPPPKPIPSVSKYSNLKKLILLTGFLSFLLLFVTSISISEANDFESLLNDLGNKSRSKIKIAVQKLGELGNTDALPALNALKNKHLSVSEEGKLVILNDSETEGVGALDGKKIDIYNKGKMYRDYTYIDDIVEGIVRVINLIPISRANDTTNAKAPFRVLNIGNNNPISLDRFVKAIETSLNMKAIKNLLPMQPGDVPETFANIDKSSKDLKFKPLTKIKDGIPKFIEWYKSYYKIK